MNNKGFTLTELLAVIVLITIVGSIAAFSVLSLNDDINENLFEAQKEIILKGAELYGQDNINDIIDICDDGNKCIEISIKEISSDYLDRSDECEKSKCILNDITGVSMEDDIIRIFIKNNRIYTEFVTINSCINSNNNECD